VLNQETQFPINLILKDELKKNQLKKFAKGKKLSIKRMRMKNYWKKLKKDKIIKKIQFKKLP